MYPNWFESGAKYNFATQLADYTGKPNLRFLQIGVFTGDASVWLLDNILTGENSELTDVDTWKGSDEDVHHSMDFYDVWKTYQEKINGYNNVWNYKMTSNQFFKDAQDMEFDFIYIDGAHTASAVIDDAVHAWQVLKSGGILAFDDYEWSHPDGDLAMPRKAIDFFIWAKQKELDVIASNVQLWVRKK